MRALLLLTAPAVVRGDDCTTKGQPCVTPAAGHCCCDGCSATGTSPGGSCTEVAGGVSHYGCSVGCSSWCCCPSAPAAPTPAPAPTPTYSRRCLAEPNRSPDDLGYALSIVCDKNNTGFDCTKINSASAADNDTAYWPNTIYHHCNYAFDGYWQVSGNGSELFCTSGGKGNPGGPGGVPEDKAGLFNCSSECTKCQMKAGTADGDAQDVVSYLCNGDPAQIQILGPLCAPINSGGAHAGDTVVEKASYLADVYYQGLRCDDPANGCGFSGHGEIVSC